MDAVKTGADWTVVNPAGRLLNPFAKVKIASDEFSFGDGYLSSVEVKLSEDKKTSSCTFTIADPGWYYANKFLNAAYATGGIDLPDALFDAEEANTPINTVNTGSVTPPSSSTWTPPSTSDELKQFASKAIFIAQEVGVDPQDLLAVMYFESTWNPALVNQIGATGLIQFMPQTSIGLGTTTTALKGMTRVQQLDYVKKYLLSYVTNGRREVYIAGGLRSLYGAILEGNAKPRGNTKDANGTSVDGALSKFRTGEPGRKAKELLASIGWNGKAATALTTPTPSPSPSPTPSPSPSPSPSPTPTPTPASTDTIYKLNVQVSTYGEGDGTDGGPTASGEKFNKEALTTAHKTLPFGTLIKCVLKSDTTKSVVVRVNDRGPYVGTREFDLSAKAMEVLTGSRTGVVAVDTYKTTSSAGTDKNAAAVKAVEQSTTAAAANKPEPSITELGNKGTLITIELAVDPDTVAVFAFIHNRTTTSFSGGVTTTSFSGTTVKWYLAQIEKNTRFQNISVKALAQKCCKEYGLNLKMDFEGPTVPSLDQRGESDYRLLRRVCDALGYRIHELGNTLVIDKLTADKAGFVLSLGEYLDSLDIDDTAQSSAISADAYQNYASGESKYAIDTSKGIFNILGAESVKATGDDGKKVATGSNVPKLKSQQLLDAAYKVERDGAKPAKEFKGSCEFPTSTAALLSVTPDTPFYIYDVMSFAQEQGRFWTVESVTHKFSGGTARTAVQFYLPTAAKRLAAASPTTGTGVTDTPVSSAVPTTTGQTVAGGKYTVISGGNSVTQLSQWNIHHSGRAYRQTTINGKAEMVRSDGGATRLVKDCVLSLGGNQSCPVPAAISGKLYLTPAAQSGGYGNLAEIRDASGRVICRMAHLRNFASGISSGQNITFGTIVGTQGTTGHSTGIHLHLEVLPEYIQRYLSALLSGSFKDS